MRVGKPRSHQWNWTNLTPTSHITLVGSQNSRENFAASMRWVFQLPQRRKTKHKVDGPEATQLQWSTQLLPAVSKEAPKLRWLVAGQKYCFRDVLEIVKYCKCIFLRDYICKKQKGFSCSWLKPDQNKTYWHITRAPKQLHDCIALTLLESCSRCLATCVMGRFEWWQTSGMEHTSRGFLVRI